MSTNDTYQSTGLPPARLVISHAVFTLAPDLLTELRASEQSRAPDRIMRERDAFLLDPGLGPPTYLTSDGRILWDDDIWDVKGTRRDVFVAVVAGIQKTKIERLRSLLPHRPLDAVDCSECRGTGRFDAHGHLRDMDGRLFSIVCAPCAGLSWTSSTIDLDESLVASIERDQEEAQS